MKFDNQINIAIGASVRTRIWKNKTIFWSKFVEQLRTPVVTNETYKEFLECSKTDQGSIKDVGGYVGAYLRNGKRSPENIVNRQLLTLDIDYAGSDFWDNYTFMYGNAAAIHSTHKHSSEKPRLRLLIPLDREVTRDEYVAVARKIAGTLDIEVFDNTTFETNRLMFWPSHSKDSEYYFEFQDGPWLNVDNILNSYIDWKDSSLWPTTSKIIDEVNKAVKKLEDPESKKGVIGVFCRTYDIYTVIDQFLDDVYQATTEGRYTYLNGSTANGLVIYEDKFAFSHHNTDPCSGKLVNAFDIVRIHKFGYLDSGKTDVKSRKAMIEFIIQDPELKSKLAKENLEKAKYEFSQIEEIKEDIDLDWAKELEVDAKGKYLTNSINTDLILSSDIYLKENFAYNEFDRNIYVLDSVPWRKINEPEPLRNVDKAGLRNYFSRVYGIKGKETLNDSFDLAAEKEAYHPVRDYLEGLRWDGKNRIDDLLIDYFGAEDNVYTREAIRKMLTGAVARIYEPGTKFDLVLTLVSEEGVGKSTFIRKLGQQWFSDSLMTVKGKEALEQIQGCWLIEMAELSALKKAEIESVKHFITKQVDEFRKAYGEVKEVYKRQCVFFGTTNDSSFLKSSTGNRRFMPLDVRTEHIKKSVFSKEFDSSINQIWAEAKELYKKGEKLYLSKEANKIANAERINHLEIDPNTGIVEDFLNTKLPENWSKMDIWGRQAYFENNDSKEEGFEREFVCIAEIWAECFCKAKEDLQQSNTRRLNDILRNLQDWEYVKSTKNFGIYGKQRYYRRKRKGIGEKIKEKNQRTERVLSQTFD